jgi:hypothetical protein
MGFKPLHAALSLTRWRVGVFRPIVQIAVLAVLHARHYLALGGLIALQLIRDDDSGDVR